MANKPLGPPGTEIDYASIVNNYVAENKDELNAAGAGESENTGTENMQDYSDTPEKVNTNASSIETTVETDKNATTKEKQETVSQERVTVDPAKVAYTADGRVVNLPIPNLLRNFASYNYRIGMYALTNEEINNPDATYRIKRPNIAILQSGGGLGDSKVLTGYESSGRKIEFFMNNLEIESLISPNQRKGTTNATGFRLEIQEPYSMGLFLQTLQMASYQAGHENYVEAPFLLTIDFIGWDQDGNPVETPTATKMLPFKLVGSDLSVTNGGSAYVVEGVAYNEGALKDATQGIPVDVTLVGRTIEELLQSSPKSLSAEMNKYYQQKAIDKTISTADQYFIVFPKTRATKGNSSGTISDGGAGATTASNNGAPSVSVSSKQSTRNTATAEELQELYKKIKGGEAPEQAELEKYLNEIKAKISTTALGEEIREKQTGKANSNVIGTSQMFNLEQLGSTQQPFGDANFTWDKEKNVWKRDGGQMQLSPGLGEIKFGQGTRIQDIIEELIIISEYGRNLTSEPSDGTGMKNWFKIDTQVFNITDPITEKKTGQPPRIYVFRVLPYKVHEAKFLSPDKIPYGIEALRKQVCKEYNYIYSGKNDDIINFNINLDNTFFKSMSPGVLPKVNVEEGKDAEENPQQTLEQTEVDNEQLISGKTAPDIKNNAKAAGAVNQDDMRIEIARRFNDAIINSNADLLSIEMEIWGDPYYISDSGFGNYNSENTQLINIDADGNIDYQSGEVDVLINFRTPVDYKENGMMGFPDETIAVDSFSGLYLVSIVKNSFNNGEFKQTIEAIRRSNQYPKKQTSQDSENKAGQTVGDGDGRKLDSSTINQINSENQKGSISAGPPGTQSTADDRIAAQQNQKILAQEQAQKATEGVQ